MKWNQWPCQLFIPRDETCLWNEISTVKTCRTAHKILLFAGGNCRCYILDHLCAAIVQLRTTTFCTTIILVAFLTMLLLLQEQHVSLPIWKGQGFVLWEWSKMHVSRRGKRESCVTAGGSEGVTCKGKDIFCSCQVYLYHYQQRTLAATDKTRDNTPTVVAYFIHTKSSPYIFQMGRKP